MELGNDLSFIAEEISALCGTQTTSDFKLTISAVHYVLARICLFMITT